MITKERVGHELYIYCNGNLMYKRWIYPSGYSYGKVFDDYKIILRSYPSSNKK